jgi:hypothetical protein
MKIVIIQNCQTQFDAPLFSRYFKNNSLQIYVYYTEKYYISNSKSDPEISISPFWDNISDLDYNFFCNKSTIRIFRDVLKIKPNLVIFCGWYPRSHAILAIIFRFLFNIKIGVRSDNTLIHTRLTGIRGRLKRYVMYFWLGVYDFWFPVGSLSAEYLIKLSKVSRNIFYFPIYQNFFSFRNYEIIYFFIIEKLHC